MFNEPVAMQVCTSTATQKGCSAVYCIVIDVDMSIDTEYLYLQVFNLNAPNSVPLSIPKLLVIKT